MAYDALTPARFKELKPQFAAVPDTIIQQYIDLAARFVDKSWSASDYEAAWVAATCHLLTLDGYGNDAESKANASGASEYQSIKSGNLTLTRFKSQVSEDTSFIGWLQSTKCGRFYALLLKMNRGGPRVVSVAAYPCVSGFAKDHSSGVYGWPGPFYGDV